MVNIAEENFVVALQIAITALEHTDSERIIKRELGWTDEQFDEVYETMVNDLAHLKTFS